MDNQKLRVKIGTHEFEAEGPEESVTRQFQEFKELVANFANSPDPRVRKETAESSRLEKGNEASDSPTNDESMRIFHHEPKTKLVTLNALPHTENRDADAALLVLLGYKLIRGEDVVLVTKLVASLKKSGCDIDRIDRSAARYIPRFIMKGGSRRGGKYQLTNQGLAEAKRLMESMMLQMI